MESMRHTSPAAPAVAQIPEALADVALIDARSAAAAAAIAVETWRAAVRNGQAPQPVVRAARANRWLLRDVREWLIRVASQGQQDVDRSVLAGRAAKASAAAAAKRRAARDAKAASGAEGDAA